MVVVAAIRDHVLVGGLWWWDRHGETVAIVAKSRPTARGGQAVGGAGWVASCVGLYSHNVATDDENGKNNIIKPVIY